MESTCYGCQHPYNPDTTGTNTHCFDCFTDPLTQTTIANNAHHTLQQAGYHIIDVPLPDDIDDNQPPQDPSLDPSCDHSNPG